MQASSARCSCSPNAAHSRNSNLKASCLRRVVHQPCSRQLQRNCTVAAAASKRLGRASLASTTVAETWTSSARFVRQKDPQRLCKVQQPQQHQPQPVRSRAQHSPIPSSGSGSSSGSQPPLPASNSQEAAAATYGPNYTLNRKLRSQHDSQASLRDQQTEPNEVLSSALDKVYKQQLREVKAMVSSEVLGQLQRDMTPEQKQSLQMVLQDLQDLEGSWEEEEEQLNAAEQQLVDQLTYTQLMPDDFGSYLLALLPDGAGPAEVQQLLRSLEPTVLQDIQSVYTDLKEFEQAKMDVSEAQERYVELSSRIAAVTARVQSTLAAQQQQQQSRQQHQWEQEQQPEPLRYSEIAATAMLSEQQGQQQQQQREPLRFSAIAFGTNSSSSTTQQQQQQQQQSQVALPRHNSSRSSSNGWGANWGKPRAARPQQPLGARQRTGALFKQQQQKDTMEQVVLCDAAQQQQQQQRQDKDGSVGQAQDRRRQQQQQQQRLAGALSSNVELACEQQQQQQQQQQQSQPSPAARQRRRRVIIRRDSSAAG